MKTNELFKAIGQMINDNDVQTYDLTTKEGYNEFKKTINELRESDTSILDMFGIDTEELLDNIDKLSDKIYNEANKEEDAKKEPKQIERKEVDHTEGTTFNRPSELLTVNQKLQLHKLVQEYVDKMIKPFNKGVLTNDQINDAYAGLYEFGAWILNR